MDWDTPGAFALFLAVGGMGLGIVLGPIGRAIGGLLEPKAGRLGARAAEEQAAELERLGQRLDELEGVERRLLELEERLDFAERLLAQQPRQVMVEGADTPPEALPAAR